MESQTSRHLQNCCTGSNRGITGTGESTGWANLKRPEKVVPMKTREKRFSKNRTAKMVERIQRKASPPALLVGM